MLFGLLTYRLVPKDETWNEKTFSGCKPLSDCHRRDWDYNKVVSSSYSIVGFFLFNDRTANRAIQRWQNISFKGSYDFETKAQSSQWVGKGSPRCNAHCFFFESNGVDRLGIFASGWGILQRFHQKIKGRVTARHLKVSSYHDCAPAHLALSIRQFCVKSQMTASISRACSERFSFERTPFFTHAFKQIFGWVCEKSFSELLCEVQISLEEVCE